MGPKIQCVYKLVKKWIQKYDVYIQFNPTNFDGNIYVYGFQDQVSNAVVKIKQELENVTQVLLGSF